MTKREAVRKFQEDFAYLYMSEVDYWKAEEWWSYFVDDLNRNGIITNRQRENWAAPFPYGKHLKLTLKDKNKLIDAVGFGVGDRRDEITIGQKLDIVCTVDLNEFNGKRMLEFILTDFKASI